MPAAPASVEPLPDGLLDHLNLPDAEGADVEHMQTHISHLFLGRRRVYKIRKPVRFPFLDFSRRAARNRDCLEELRLNRRLSPDVYLGIAPIRRSAAGFELGPLREDLDESTEDAACEHCVVMRRLPEGGDARSLLEAGRLSPVHLDAIADRLARFHEAHRLDDPELYPADAWLKHVSDPILQTLEMLQTESDEPAFRERARALEARVRQRLAASAGEIEVRRREGLAVDGHGDLHLAHVWFEGAVDSPLIIDCIEFDRNLRWIDAASEVAFLAMDLVYRKHPTFAEHFLARYARETDDYGLYRVVDLYASYRAAVRGKVALLLSQDDSVDAAERARARERARERLALAERSLAGGAGGAVFIVCGVVGSGKSTLANVLADQLGAVPIGSDRTRKRIAGIPVDVHRRPEDDPRSDLYDEGRTEAVYAGLLDRAGAVVSSGRPVVLDATFALARHRSAVRAWAAERNIPARLIEVCCDREVAIERLRAREREGLDPSDAGPSLYPWSVKRFEPLSDWPEQDRARIRTDSPSWREELRQVPFVRDRASPNGGDGTDR